MSRIILITIATLITTSVLGQKADTKYVELINKKVDSFEAPYGLPQILEETIDTTGYSEIRVFIQVFAENYKKDPVTSKSLIDVSLFLNTSQGSHTYSNKKIKSNVTSYISGWFSEKIIGNRTRIVAFAKDFPKGPYSILVTYYLVK